MNLSISNIAWDASEDAEIYGMMKELGISGLEIAPTRIFPENPYDHTEEARRWKKDLYDRYGFRVSSMQSIWYGKQEKLFGSENERTILLSYTKKAIDFAEAVGCGNLVFGCPKNRVIPDEMIEWPGVKKSTEGSENHTEMRISPEGSEDHTDKEMFADKIMNTAVSFFREIGDYAYRHHTVVALEANPKIYNTNFINTTKEAAELVEIVDSRGFLLNLDTGTMIENEETVDVIRDKGKLINHVHFSEPYLKALVKRDLHQELAEFLKCIDYKGWISIETGRPDDGPGKLREMMEYLKGIFN